MVLILQISLFFLGGWLMTRSRIRFGMQELRAPFTTFAGMILVLQLPTCVGIGFAIGGAEGIKAMREGNEPKQVASKVQKKYGWLDIAVPVVAAALAGTLAAGGLRDIVLLPPPSDEPIGITDYRLRSDTQWDGSPFQSHEGGHLQ